MLRRLLEASLERIYPPTCVLCSAAGHGGLDLCPGCLADLPNNFNHCRRCALPLPAGASVAALCGECQRRPPSFDACYAAFRYEDPLPALVGGAKFRSRLELARLLGQCLARTLFEQGVGMPALDLEILLEHGREAGFARRRRTLTPFRHQSPLSATKPAMPCSRSIRWTSVRAMARETKLPVCTL